MRHVTTDREAATNLPPPAPSDLGSLRVDTTSALRIGTDLHSWEARVEQLKASGATFVTFRGAGSVNGIDPEAEGIAVARIRDGIIQLRASGQPVVLMYDGDGDNRAKPDIGSVFGKIADVFANDTGVIAVAAQSEGWYGPPTESAPIKSAHGTPYETYVFSDSLPGQHASLTQSGSLVGYEKYEQIFVGPVGEIAFKQLKDLSEKAVASRPPESEPLRVTVFGTPNNSALDAQLSEQSAAAGDNQQLKTKIEAKLSQRRDHPFGFMFSSGAEFCVEAAKFPGLAFEVAFLTPKM